jgi:hypothetical protein
MTDELSFTSAARTLFMNRENHENRENFRDITHSPLPFTTTIWPYISEVIACEQSNLLN